MSAPMHDQDSMHPLPEGREAFSLKGAFRQLGWTDLPLILTCLAVPLLPTNRNGLALRLIALTLLALFAFFMLPLERGGYRWKLRSRAHPLDLYFLLWLVCVLLGVGLAHNHGFALYRMSTIITLAMLYYAFTTRTTGYRKALAIVAAAGLAAVAVSLVELFASPMARLFTTAAEGDRLPSQSLLFIHSYLAAQYLLPVFIMMLAFAINRGSLSFRIAAAACSVPVLIYLFVIGSRGAYLAVLISFSFVLLLRVLRFSRRQGLAGLSRALWLALPVVFVGAAAVFILSATGVLGGLGHRVAERVSLLFNPDLAEFNFSRLGVWEDALRMGRDHLLLGVGLGNFSTVFPQYYLETREILHAHNQFIQTFCENGALGLVCFLAVLVHLFKTMRRDAKRTIENDLVFALRSGAAGALMAAGIYCCFETPLEWPASASFLLVPLAILLLPLPDGETAGPAPFRRPPWCVVAGAAVVLGIFPGIHLVRAACSGVLGEKGYHLLKAAQFEEAEKVLDGAARVWPYRPEIYFCLAETLKNRGRIEEALEMAERSLSLRPGAAKVLAVSAQCLFLLGRHREFRDRLRNYIMRIPLENSLTPYFMLGKSYRASGMPEAALIVFRDLNKGRFDPAMQAELLLETADTLFMLKRDPPAIIDILFKAFIRSRGRVANLEKIVVLLDGLEEEFFELDRDQEQKLNYLRKQIERVLEEKKES